MKRKIITILIFCFSSLLVLSGCDIPETYYSDEFYYQLIDDNSIAIGDLNSNFSSDYIFVPQEIEGYTVKQLGFGSGLGFGGLTSYSPNKYSLERFYCPNTVEVIDERYMIIARRLKVFYCGKVVNLGLLNASAEMDDIEYYVPDEMYTQFYAEIYDSCQNSLFKANVVYLLNYEADNKYFYVDNYEYGSLIEYIPPVPTREGYEFNGWYTEEECINEWNYQQSKLPLLAEGQEFIETKLYAKWTKN